MIEFIVIAYSLYAVYFMLSDYCVYISCREFFSFKIPKYSVRIHSIFIAKFILKINLLLWVFRILVENFHYGIMKIYWIIKLAILRFILGDCYWVIYLIHVSDYSNIVYTGVIGARYYFHLFFGCCCFVGCCFVLL